MKTIKMLFACLFAIALGAGVSAFTSTNQNKVGKSTVYYYTSNDNSLTEMKKISNWQGVEPEEGCGETGDVPCTFTYSGDFAAHLNSFTLASALINAADSRREP